MNYSHYIIPFIVACLLSVIFTKVAIKMALRFRIVDEPSMQRKIHDHPIPLLGGWAVFLSFTVVVCYYVFVNSHGLFGNGYIKTNHVLGMMLGILILLIGGTLDDKYHLSWKQQIICPLLSILVIMLFGVTIQTITNPLGGYFNVILGTMDIPIAHGIIFSFVALADLLTFGWIISLVYTTKLLDGLDGLVTGITLIASFFLFLVSLRHDLMQYDTALLAIIMAGALLGFLVFNWHPAKIFLGEGGSLITGYMLGVLSIVAGGKITTALLVMGIPILDVVWIVGRRWLVEKKSPLSTSDKKHLHFRLLESGLSHRKTVLLYYFFAIMFGSLVFFVQGSQKLLALFSLCLFMFFLAIVLVFKYNKSK